MQLQTAVPNDVLRCIMCSAGLPESDEGRAWCGARQSCMTCELDAYDSIADELGKAQDERFDNEMWKQGYDAGFASADDWLAQHEDAMAEHGWVRLPKDADGEYIHVNDEVIDWDTPRVVVAVSEDSICLAGYESDSYYRMGIARNYAHYHKPTVEDVLREFAEKITDSQIPNVHPTYEEAIAEYTAKLRLAGDAE